MFVGSELLHSGKAWIVLLLGILLQRTIIILHVFDVSTVPFAHDSVGVHTGFRGNRHLGDGQTVVLFARNEPQVATKALCVILTGRLNRANQIHISDGALLVSRALRDADRVVRRSQMTTLFESIFALASSIVRSFRVNKWRSRCFTAHHTTTEVGLVDRPDGVHISAACSSLVIVAEIFQADHIIVVYVGGPDADAVAASVRPSKGPVKHNVWVR